MSVEEVMAELLRPDIARDGVTLSGGDPLAQPEACVQIVRLVKEVGVHTIIYTGFAYEQLLRDKNPAIHEVMALADVLVDGPFVAALVDESLAYRGSTNQRAIDMAKTRETVILRLADWD